MATADYPTKLPTLPIVTDGQQYPRSEPLNKLYREIEAWCTEMGIDPTTISDAVAPGASPTSVANLMDMIATAMKTITGAANWHTSNVPRRIMLGGNGQLATIPAGATRFAGPGGPALNATENLVHMIVPIHCEVVLYRIYINSAQPGTGALGTIIRKDDVDSTIYGDIAAGSAAGNYTPGTVTPVEYFPGQKLSLRLVNNAAAASAQIGVWTLHLRQKG